MKKNLTYVLDEEANKFLELKNFRYKDLVGVSASYWFDRNNDYWETVWLSFPWHWNTRLSEPSGWCYSIGAKIARKWATYKRKRIDLDALKQDLEVVAQEVKDYLDK